MKKNNLLSALLYGLVACCIAVSGVGCIVTAFGFGPAVSFASARVDMTAVVLWSAALSLLSAFVFSQKRGWVALAVMIMAVVGALAVTGQLRELHALAYRISIFYNKAYGWGTLPEPSYAVDTMGQAGVHMVKLPGITGGLVAICALVVVLSNWALVGKRPAAVAVAAGAFPLLLCCVVTDTVPEERYLFLLLAGLILVMLTAVARRSGEKAGASLTALLIVPVLLASMLLSYMLPREAYETQSAEMLETMLGWVEDLPFLTRLPDGTLELSVTGKAPETVNLAAAGPLPQADYPVLDVVAPVTGLLYLRGQSFDSYTGKGWYNSPKSTGTDEAWPQKGRDIGLVTVRTRSRLAYRFVPYYTKGNRELENGTMADPEGNREYSYMLIDPKVESVGMLPSMSVVCTELYSPVVSSQAGAIFQHAVKMAGEKYDDLKIRDKWAACIADYVRNSAVYSRSAPAMPEGAEDFAIWFLENGDTGYCVHFATAATVLLRAAGVPARYVTGYAVEAVAGQKVTVTANKAHAWVEYLNDNNIWTVLEVTPGDWSSDQPATDPTPTDGSTEAPTEPEPTAPTPTGPDVTQPSERPTDTQPPTVPGQTGGGNGQEQEADRTAMLRVFNWIIGILMGLLVLTGQYALRQQLRKNKLKKGSPNQQALARWRWMRRMSRITGLSIPEELEFLAEKAKFSQHTLSEEELARLDAWLEQAQQTLRKKPWPVKLALRLLWAA